MKDIPNEIRVGSGTWKRIGKQPADGLPVYSMPLGDRGEVLLKLPAPTNGPAARNSPCGVTLRLTGGSRSTDVAKTKWFYCEEFRAHGYTEAALETVCRTAMWLVQNAAERLRDFQTICALRQTDIVAPQWYCPATTHDPDDYARMEPARGIECVLEKTIKGSSDGGWDLTITGAAQPYVSTHINADDKLAAQGMAMAYLLQTLNLSDMIREAGDEDTLTVSVPAGTLTAKLVGIEKDGICLTVTDPAGKELASMVVEYNPAINRFMMQIHSNDGMRVTSSTSEF